MNKDGKIELGNQLKEKLQKAQVAIFADYKGLSSPQADEFRRVLRAQKVEVKVLKNNIARQAVKDGSLGEGAKEVMDGVVGPTLVALAYGDPAAAAKAVFNFSKDNEALKLKDSLMGKNKISAADVEQLAKLPSREVMLAMLLGTMKAPIRNFASVLAAVPRGLVTVLAAIEKKKSEAQQ